MFGAPLDLQRDAPHNRQVILHQTIPHCSKRLPVDCRMTDGRGIDAHRGWNHTSGPSASAVLQCQRGVSEVWSPTTSCKYPSFPKQMLIVVIYGFHQRGEEIRLIATLKFGKGSIILKLGSVTLVFQNLLVQCHGSTIL